MGRTAQKCIALLGHETKTTTLIWNYCLGSTAAAFLLLGIFFGLILGNIGPSPMKHRTTGVVLDVKKSSQLEFDILERHCQVYNK